MLFLFDGGFPCFRNNFLISPLNKNHCGFVEVRVFLRGVVVAVSLSVVFLFGEDVTSLESVGL